MEKRKIKYFLFILMFISLYSCSINKELILGSGFENKDVKVWLLGTNKKELIFQGNINSSLIAGVAQTVNIKYKASDFKGGYLYIIIEEEIKIIFPIDNLKKENNILDVIFDANNLKSLHLKSLKGKYH